MVFGTGFRKVEDIAIIDYQVSPDENTLTVKVTRTSSVGYVRTYQKKENPDTMTEILTFYSSFGSPLLHIGAKDTYEIPLRSTTRKIVLDCGKTQKEIFQKNKHNKWEEVQELKQEIGKQNTKLLLCIQDFLFLYVQCEERRCQLWKEHIQEIIVSVVI